MKRITIDTICINLKQKNEFINQLEDWHRQRLIEIHKTSVMDKEFDKSTRKKENLEKSSECHEILESGIFDESLYNHSEFNREDKFDEICSILFPEFKHLSRRDFIEKHKSEFRDVQQLVTHYKAGNDFFITLNTGHFIEAGKRERLKEIGIFIMTPEECIKYLQNEMSLT